MDTVANACEDISNGVPFNTTEDDDLMNLILDHAHIADSTLSEEIQLPDAPTLREAMAGSEHCRREISTKGPITLHLAKG